MKNIKCILELLLELLLSFYSYVDNLKLYVLILPNKLRSKEI